MMEEEEEEEKADCWHFREGICNYRSSRLWELRKMMIDINDR